MNKTDLINCGVKCDRVGEVFTLTVPRHIQLELLGGDLSKCTKRINDQVHEAIFSAFNLNYRKEWEMESSGDNTVFRQLWDDSLEAEDLE